MDPQQQRPAITGIAFVRVFTVHDAASADFYSKTLGFSADKTGDLTRYAVNDSQWIELTPLRSLRSGPRLAAVGFMTRDVRALAAISDDARRRLVEPLERGRFSVRDPEGNLIYFVQQVKGPAIPTPVPATATSRRIIHAGLIVKDAAAEDRFYRDLLGFRPYWHGGRTDTDDGLAERSRCLRDPTGSSTCSTSDPLPSQKQYGVSDHFSLGVTHMSDAIAALAAQRMQGTGVLRGEDRARRQDPGESV